MSNQALSADFEMIVASMRAEFIEETRDRLDAVDDALDAIEENTGRYENNLLEVQRLVHSIKGSAGCFGFHSISRIAHALEDFMEVLSADGRLPVRPSRAFIAAIERIVESGAEPDDEELTALLEALPAPHQRSVHRTLTLKGKAVVLMPVGLQRKIMAQELVNFGFRVSIADDPLEVIDAALATRPDIVVTTMRLDRMSGLDVARALSVIERTAHIKVAVLTADDVGPYTPNLPDGTGIIRKGPNMARDFLAWLKRHGIH